MKRKSTMRKIQALWRLVKAKHYALLVADSKEEISWAIESLRKADIPTNVTKEGSDV